MRGFDRSLSLCARTLLLCTAWIASGAHAAPGLQQQLATATGATAAPDGSLKTLLDAATRPTSSRAATTTASANDEIFWDSFELCGDGVIEAPEQCDRSALGTATCSSLGYGGGVLACDRTCHYDTSQCGCKLAHSGCASDGDCCSGHCDVNTDGVSRCSEPNQCAPLGSACARAADCCSLDCDANAHTCSSAGQCGLAGTSCSSPLQCCTGSCSGGVCQSTSGTLGEFCSGNSGCLSGVCHGGRCDFDAFCRAAGDLCTTGSDCCTGVCNANNRCDTENLCVTNNEPCTALRSCCNTLCVGTAQLPQTCAPISGCTALQDVCSQNADCCSGTCNPVDANGLRRCGAASCVADGDVCGGQGASQNCCSGGKAACVTTGSGVARCWPNAGGACAANGAACNFADQCCNHVCVPNAVSATGFACASGCLAAGSGTCTTTADCCSGSVCEYGICQSGGPQCVSLGGLCTDSTQCCLGSCISGTCRF